MRLTAFFLSVAGVASALSWRPLHDVAQKPLSKLGKSNLVPVTLGVMSKCEDAEYCENTWDKVLDKVSDKIALQLVYIGKLDDDERYGVKCKHGESECTGNIQQLCFARAFPEQKTWWNFVQCQNYGPTSRIGDEVVAERCARTVGKDWADVRPCVEGERGTSLLKASVRLAEHMGIEKSCSIFIDNELVCIRDNGQWKECPAGHDTADFVQQIRDAYDDLNAQ